MRNKSLAWGMLSPTLMILVFVGMAPFIYVLYISFFRYNIFAAKRRAFIGLNNYRMLLSDERFLHSLAVGTLFVLCVCLIELPLGFILAKLLNRRLPGRRIFRAIFTLPLTIAPIVVGAIWVLMTNPDIGPLPAFFSSLGITYNIGNNAIQAYLTTIAMDVWHWTPFVTLAFMAGLGALPKTPFESARVDGANRWQLLIYITLPMMKPIIATVLLIRVMDSFKIFDEVWMLTGGGPAQTTRFVSIHIVRKVLSEINYGYGAGMSIMILYLAIIVCWLLLVFIRREST